MNRKVRHALTGFDLVQGQTLMDHRLVACADNPWFIWFDRNERVHGKEGRSGAALVEAAKVYVGAFLAALDVSVHPPVLLAAAWCKPKEGEVKINVDVAANPVLETTGLGIICRNSVGVVIGARAIPIRSAMGVEVAETPLVVLEGLRFAISLGLQAIEVNSDTLRVVKMLLDNSLPRADAGVFILDALDLAKSFFKVSYFHVLRSANEEANSLAAFAVRADSLCS
ncbi:hypothetical protein LguiA_001058 [Lonicera macranthoides]